MIDLINRTISQCGHQLSTDPYLSIEHDDCTRLTTIFEATEYIVLAMVVQNDDRAGHCEAIFVINLQHDGFKKVTDIDMSE